MYILPRVIPLSYTPKSNMLIKTAKIIYKDANHREIYLRHIFSVYHIWQKNGFQ